MARRGSGSVEGTPESVGNPASGNTGESGDDQTGTGSDYAELGGIPIIDPAAFGGNAGGVAPDSGSIAGERKKRGRKPGSGNAGRKPTAKETSVSVIGIEKILLSAHEILATLTKVPEFKISDDEAKVLSESIGNVAKHYSVELNPKYLAWAGLIGVLGMVYGPRLAMVRVRKSQEKMPRKTASDNDADETQPISVDGFAWMPGQMHQ